MASASDLTYELLASFVPVLATHFAEVPPFIDLLATEFNAQQLSSELPILYEGNRFQITRHLLLHGLQLHRDRDDYVTHLHTCVCRAGRLTVYKMLLSIHGMHDLFAPEHLQLFGL